VVIQREITLPAFPRGYHLVTDLIMQQADFDGTGLLHIFIKHTSAAITINENADPTVLQDFESIFNKLVPENMPFLKHTIEGPDDMPAHIKATMIGSSVTIPITKGWPNFGTWQGIYLCEFRNHGGPRKLVLTIYG
jgi:secondary thiamine-phosphate synthase enzyme